MSKVVYRGVEYDTETPKEEYRKWYSQTHDQAHPSNTYRGVAYCPCKNKEVAK